MPHEVGRKSRRDHQIDVVGSCGPEIEHAPRRGVGEDLARWMPSEGKRHELRKMPPLSKLRDEAVHVRLGTPRNERHLRCADDDPFHAEPCYHPLPPAPIPAGGGAGAKASATNRGATGKQRPHALAVEREVVAVVRDVDVPVSARIEVQP